MMDNIETRAIKSFMEMAETMDERVKVRVLDLLDARKMGYGREKNFVNTIEYSALGVDVVVRNGRSAYDEAFDYSLSIHEMLMSDEEWGKYCTKISHGDS